MISQRISFTINTLRVDGGTCGDTLSISNYIGGSTSTVACPATDTSIVDSVDGAKLVLTGASSELATAFEITYSK